MSKDSPPRKMLQVLLRKLNIFEATTRSDSIVRKFSQKETTKRSGKY
jgi:pyruvate/oxaloacetate carboxyltransferase